MVIAEVGWLHAAGQAAGTILLLELGLVLILVAALMVGFAVAAWWLRKHVVPVLDEYAPKAQQAMTVAQQSSDKVVNGVAEFYGRRQQVETSIRVLLFGKAAAQRVHDEALSKAAEELEIMNLPEQTPSPENGFTPRLRAQPTELLPDTRDSRDSRAQRLPAPNAVPREAPPSEAVTFRPRTPTHPSADHRDRHDDHHSHNGHDGHDGTMSNLAGNAG